MATHAHKCGFVYERTERDPPASVRGCGHTWTHERPENVSDEQYAAEHMCPKCGAGPWYWARDPELRRTGNHDVDLEIVVAKLLTRFLQR